MSKNVYLERQDPVELVYYTLDKVSGFLVLRSHCFWLVGFCLFCFVQVDRAHKSLASILGCTLKSHNWKQSASPLPPPKVVYKRVKKRMETNYWVNNSLFVFFSFWGLFVFGLILKTHLLV